LALLLAKVINTGTVRGALVVALAVFGAGIMNLEKELENRTKVRLFSVELYFNRFRVCSVVAVCRIFNISTTVSNPRVYHARLGSD